MISVILYGRNDNYGYNLHKRAAISLNCIAEILTEPTDEILFVDYNTANDMPTFPEAIRDTLTPKTRKLLRIIRVRGDIHLQVQRDSPLQVNEALARNIAIRRTRPDNNWILSTNTDMVFVPKSNESLSQIVADLEDGYYALPRFEMPESLWESADRSDPVSLMRAFNEWGVRFLLNETVLARPYMFYDGPGDFQLCPRAALELLHGFNESMIYGWHVDSNLCKRIYLHYGNIKSLDNYFRGYHCDHTRVETPAHSANRIENQWSANCDNITSPFLPEQEKNWGRPLEEFEIITLSDSRTNYETVLCRLMPDNISPQDSITYADNSFNNHFYYNTLHTFPYIADNLVSLPKNWQVAYVGTNITLLRLLGDFIRQMGYEKPVLFHKPLFCQIDYREADRFLDNYCHSVKQTTSLLKAQIFILDSYFMKETAVKNDKDFSVLGLTPYTLSTCINRFTIFLEIAAAEQDLILQGQNPRKFITIGLQHTIFEKLMTQVIGLIAVPFSCHIRHGFVRQDADISSALAVFKRLTLLDNREMNLFYELLVETCGKLNQHIENFDTYHKTIQIYNEWCKSSMSDSEIMMESKSTLFQIGVVFFSILGYFDDTGRIYGKYMQNIMSPGALHQLQDKLEEQV